VRRREFITLVGGAATGWPLAARAQQREQMRRIGVLMSAASDTDQQAGLAVFKEILHQLDWIDGRNMRIEVRWARGDPAEARRGAEELVALPADVIMVAGQLGLEVLMRMTPSVPIIFNSIIDPVGSGYIDSLARPGGNATGFITVDYALAAKWAELLKEIAPTVTRVAVLRDSAIAAGIGQIEQDITRFASSPSGGLIVVGSAPAVVHQKLIVALAAQHKLPAVYYRRYFVTSGGLISYGWDTDDQYRGAARYVDRILKGDKPADLPVQAPTKYELVVNLKTAKALGLTIPQSVLTRADDVIE